MDNLNTARASYIKHNSPEDKEVVDFEDAVNTYRLNATNFLR
jgi:hypothetical protein